MSLKAGTKPSKVTFLLAKLSLVYQTNILIWNCPLFVVKSEKCSKVPWIIHFFPTLFKKHFLILEAMWVNQSRSSINYD